MKALTLIQPWAYAIAHLGKDVENRTWAPPSNLGRFAIHAGLKMERESLDAFIAEGYPDMHGANVHGAVVAVATLSHVIDATDPPSSLSPYRRWFLGPVGWVLKDVIALPEPVPARGAQGLWHLPTDIENAVTVQMCEALRRRAP